MGNSQNNQKKKIKFIAFCTNVLYNNTDISISCGNGTGSSAQSKKITVKEYRRMKKRKMNNKGFTLVELIVVLVILAILAAILVPTLMGYNQTSTRHEHYNNEAQDNNSR